MRCLSEEKSCRLFDLAYAHIFSCLVGLLHRTVSLLPQCESDDEPQSAGTSDVLSLLPWLDFSGQRET